MTAFRHEHCRTPEMTEFGLDGHWHIHAHSEVPHAHLFRQICGREECKEFKTHDIHPSLKEDS